MASRKIEQSLENMLSRSLEIRKNIENVVHLMENPNLNFDWLDQKILKYLCLNNSLLFIKFLHIMIRS